MRAVLDTWSEQLRDLRTLRVEYEQEKYKRFFRKPRRSRGVTLLRGRKVLMQVFDADDRLETVISVDGDQLEIYQPRFETVEIYPIDRGAERPAAPFPLVVDDIEQLARENEIRLAPRTDEDPESARTLVLTPRVTDGDAEQDPGAIREVRMRFVDGRLVEVRQQVDARNRVVMRIRKFEVNAPVSEDDVRLEIPDGTEVQRVVPKTSGSGEDSKGERGGDDTGGR